MRINNINKSNFMKRNIPEDDLLSPPDFKKETLNIEKDTIKNKGLSDDEENNIFNQCPNKYTLYIQEDKDKNKKIYTYHKEHGFTYDLRCKDRNCEGRAQYDITDKIIKIKQDCSIGYNEHNYIKEKLFFEKIEKNMVNENEIKEYENQKFYFKYMHLNYPTKNYLDIANDIISKFKINHILYKKTDFNNLIERIKKIKKFEFSKEQSVDAIELEGQKLLIAKATFYVNDGNKIIEKTLRIYGNKLSMNLLHSSDINQYFVDCTYRCVPAGLESANSLLLLIGYNIKYDLYELCCVGVLSHESKDIFSQFYCILKNIYNFQPKILTYDFDLANIGVVKEVFGDGTLSLPCLFHLVNAWWRKASKLNLRKKEFVKDTRALIFNLELLPFMEINNARIFYNKIKEFYNEDYFQEFYDYFENTWLSENEKINTKFDTDLWFYYGKFKFNGSRKYLINDDKFHEYVAFSNNACESVNHLINSFIQTNVKVSIDRFGSIIKILFVRLNCQHEQQKNKEIRIKLKNEISDVLLELIRLGFGNNNKIIKSSDLSKLRKIPDEAEIVKIYESI